MLRVILVFCLTTVVCAAPLENAVRKNGQLIEKEPIPAKRSLLEHEALHLEPSDVLALSDAAVKRSSEKEMTLEDKRRFGRKQSMRKNKKGWGNHKDKNYQKQQGKAKYQAGKSEDESPTNTTQQESTELGTIIPVQDSVTTEPTPQAQSQVIPSLVPTTAQEIVQSNPTTKPDPTTPPRAQPVYVVNHYAKWVPPPQPIFAL